MTNFRKLLKPPSTQISAAVIMTRLRIKTADGKVERITVPDESTLRELKETIAKGLLRHTSTTQVKLSLNKKVELEGAGGDTLRAAGICSGDTLWLMTPSDQKSSVVSLTANVKSATATSTANVKPAMATSTAAPPALGALQAHETMAAPSDASAPLPTVRNSEDDAMQYPAQDEPLPEAKPSFPDLLQRVLDSCSEPTHNPHQLMLLTVHAVMLETGMQLAHQASKYALPDESLSRCSNVCHVDYTLQQQRRQVVCEIKYIGLGAGMACIVAASHGNRITTLNVSLTHHLKMQQQQQPGHDCDSTTSAFSDLQQLWTELKDHLAMKVFASLRQSAGLPPPLGLLALPAELKTKILASLQAKDLAMMECCCTELRHTASNDLFWQPLFQQEFGFVTSYEFIQAGRLGWQRIYGLKWADREKMRRHSRRHPRLPTTFPSRGIFAPPGPPGGITGGDYDRLPQPFLGGTPGMFGGGSGGSSFGGQGPAPSFFLGGRGTGRAARAAGNFRLA